MSDHRCGSTRTNSGEPCQQPVPEAGARCRYHPEIGWAEDLTHKQRRFVEEYTVDFNATQAAIRAGYSQKTASQLGYQLLQNPSVSEALDRRLDQVAMSADEALKRLADWGRGDVSPFLSVTEDGRVRIELSGEDARRNLHLIRELKQTERWHGEDNEILERKTEIKLHDAKDAVKQIARAHGAFVDKIEHSGEIDTGGVVVVPGMAEPGDWRHDPQRQGAAGPRGNGAGGG